MKIFFLPLLLFGILSCTSSKNLLPDNSDSSMTENPTDNSNKLTYLALGDSYTIGEGVSDAGSYPSQLVTKLNSETKKNWSTPKVIAQTGWTVEELEKGINSASIMGETYDLVSLSIGVNNQYRGLPISKFESEFETMLLRAISFAEVNSNHVLVLSIPDWGVTPFALQSNRDKDKIAEEISAYNKIKSEICQKHGVTYIDITSHYRNMGAQPDMLAADGLHPSAKMYGFWTDKLYDQVKKMKF